MDTLKFCTLDEEDLKKLLESRVNPKRYIHSLNVAKRAAFLAEKYGADVEKAEFAGLVHDICKGIPEEEQLAIIKRAGIALDEDTLKSPALWHSIAGAVYIKKSLSVSDADVINAVRYHTSGRAGMSLVEKVVYIADLTSEDRKYPDAEHVRALADEDLTKCLAFSARWIAKDVQRRGLPVGKDSLALVEELKDIEI